MFTGIVSDIGEVTAAEPRAQGLARLTIACVYDAETIAIGAPRVAYPSGDNRPTLLSSSWYHSSNGRLVATTGAHPRQRFHSFDR